MMKLYLLLLATIANGSAYFSYGATDGSYFAWRARIAKVKKEKPHMCSFLDLTRPTLQWEFPANITCTNDVSKLGLLGKVPVGLKCAYTYSCDMDLPGYHRRTTMECSSNGKWKGNMPDCSFEDKMVDEIVELFNHRRLPTFFPPQEEREEEEEKEFERRREGEEREEEREESPKKENMKKAIFIKPLKPDNLWPVCKNENLCPHLNRYSDCLIIVPDVNLKFLPNIRKMMLGLCVHCFKHYCRKTIKLL